MENKISVIIPLFNEEKYIERCLNSVLNQSYPADEIIVVDDCSTENSLKIVLSFAENNPNLKVIIHEKNKGIAETLNTAIKHSKGDFIVWISGDDEWHENKLEIQKEYAQIYPDDILYTDYCIVNEYSHVLKRVLSPQLSDEEFRLRCMFGNPINFSSCWFPKQVFKKVGLFNQNFRKGGEDYEWLLRAVLNKINFRRVPGFLLNYRVHDKMTTKSILEVYKENERKIKKSINLELE